MPLTHLLFEVRDRVAHITVNRPDKLNALNDAVIAQLGDAAEAIATRQDVAGAIITGAGAKAFVAGADIAELARQGPLEANHFGLLAATEDMREGMAAFLEKRDARFAGK